MDDQLIFPMDQWLIFHLYLPPKEAGSLPTSVPHKQAYANAVFIASCGIKKREHVPAVWSLPVWFPSIFSISA